jgi:hypothetical protein
MIFIQKSYFEIYVYIMERIYGYTIDGVKSFTSCELVHYAKRLDGTIYGP